jgi:hypothetical protein
VRHAVRSDHDAMAIGGGQGDPGTSHDSMSLGGGRHGSRSGDRSKGRRGSAGGEAMGNGGESVVEEERRGSSEDKLGP